MGKQLKVLEHHANLRTQLSQVGAFIIDWRVVYPNFTLLDRFKAINRFY
ncbi:hypothetical protein XBKB1_2060013 [Xenorhabdus bovienii str. kraussei Becker Underwood]|uniref:Uncharacterized protein n=1 Tax=Xenorhabdus bovienii str. kraussei Becker Underwood TaxID=1398204 RepID=A0A077PVB9_XENBV|nr:hypothetical protein XBFFR1_80012 [Xenorhabdus bovienii str. feltiae France]CDH23799.1 hypothetical protein XBKB1_2060013 [Xenorhabdus bovienii str. kraussei Becker Underwood]